MQQRLSSILRTVVAAIVVSVFMGSMSQVSAQDSNATYLCVDEPVLGMLDPKDDGVLTAKELNDIAARYPDNQTLQGLVKQIGDENVDGIRYEGECVARGQDGESVQGRDGESVQGQDGESVQGEDGESVVIVGSAGADTQDEASDVPAADAVDESGVVCQPNEALTIADMDRDGVVSVDEIQGIIDLVGGHAELEALLEEVVASGITGIRYVECDPGTPMASPVATPGASPVSTPAMGRGVPEHVREADTGKTHVRQSLLVVGAGGSTLVAAGLYLWRRLKA